MDKCGLRNKFVCKPSLNACDNFKSGFVSGRLNIR